MEKPVSEESLKIATRILNEYEREFDDLKEYNHLYNQIALALDARFREGVDAVVDVLESHKFRVAPNSGAGRELRDIIAEVRQSIKTGKESK